MANNSARTLLITFCTVAILLAAQASALASVGPSVNGGGVVGGPPGVTSQLGMHASATGGNFLCIMAGRSGGFPFGPWASISQMQVQGSVTPGTLTVTGSSSTFTGLAMVHVVGKTPSGDVLTMTFPNVPYVSSQGAGGAGVAWHWLQIPAFGIDTGISALKSGHISISP
jgi:hypothetical protein